MFQKHSIRLNKLNISIQRVFEFHDSWIINNAPRGKGFLDVADRC